MDGRTVVPTFHPAAILHGGGESSRQFQMLRADFEVIRRRVAGAPRPPTPSRRAPASSRAERLPEGRRSSGGGSSSDSGPRPTRSVDDPSPRRRARADPGAG